MIEIAHYYIVLSPRPKNVPNAPYYPVGYDMGEYVDLYTTRMTASNWADQYKRAGYTGFWDIYQLLSEVGPDDPDTPQRAAGWYIVPIQWGSHGTF